MPLLRRGVVIHHSLPLGGRWRRQPPDEGKLLDADSVAIGGPGGTSNRGAIVGAKSAPLKTPCGYFSLRSLAPPPPNGPASLGTIWVPFSSVFGRFKGVGCREGGYPTRAQRSGSYWEEETQGSGPTFRRQAEREGSALWVDDNPPFPTGLCLLSAIRK